MSFLLGSSIDENVSSLTWKGELRSFWSEPSLEVDLCPLDWWRKNDSCFPIVAQLAKRYLCVPATLVPSECVFSIAGMVVSLKRSSLKPKNVDNYVDFLE